jgi:hypothetical protein
MIRPYTQRELEQIKDALDTLGLALLGLGYQWGNHDRRVYNRAIHLLDRELANVDA